MEAISLAPPKTSSTLNRGARRGPTVETILYIVILMLALFSRFALLDSQAMHHDEGIHAKFSWDIYQSGRYVHDAVYHGPFIYHSGALAYLLFGDSDVTARLMPALFSVATVMLPVLLRRQLGRWGALIASSLLLISPSFLYFGRFVRNDVFGAFWTLLLFICIVRYLAERHSRWLYGVAAVTLLYFCTKETAYITVATFGLFLAGRLLWERFGLNALWPLLGFLPAALEDLWKRLTQDAAVSLTPEAAPALPLSWLSLIPLALAGLAILTLLAWCWWEGRAGKSANPNLDLVIILGTMTLPLLSAIPLNLLVRLWGKPPIDYHSPDIPPDVIILAIIAIGFTFALAAAIGLSWNVRRWCFAAGLFWGGFFLLQTSVFTSMTGWATGLVQALGFWLGQQGVKRIHVGPQYYLVLMPVYELVSVVFGTLGLFLFGWRGLLQDSSKRSSDNAANKAKDAAGEDAVPSAVVEAPTAEEKATPPSRPSLGASPGLAMGLLVWWAPVGLVIYSLAGEQVPWLNVHPTLPFLLLAAALIGRVISYRPLKPAPEIRRRWADLSLLILTGLLILWAGRPLFQEIVASPQIETSTTLALILSSPIWLISTALLLGAAYAAFHALRAEVRGEIAWMSMGGVAAGMSVIGAGLLSFREGYMDWWGLYVPLALVVVALVIRTALLGKRALRSGALLLFGLLCAYSLSSAWRVAYINNDTPIEMLVYVQTSSDVQRVMDEMATLSTLTTGGNDLVFLYDSEVAWPLEWYVRNYPRKVYQGTITGPPSDAAALALVYKDKDNTSSPYLERRFHPTRYYIFNWWFPEDIYRSARGFVQRAAPELLSETDQEKAGWQLALRALARPSGQARVWRYLLYRETLTPLGAREFAYYLRYDLVAPLEQLQDTIPPR